MKLPKRMFKNRPNREAMVRLEAEAEEAAKNLPSQHPDCPPGIQEMLDDLIRMAFQDLPECPLPISAMRRMAEMVFGNTVHARRRGVALEAFLFETLATPEVDSLGLDDEFHEFCGEIFERLIRCSWGILDAHDRIA